MFDQAQRSIWLEEQLWHKLRDAFPELKQLPGEVLITVGYPSSGARGRSEKIKPCEVNAQWHGNDNEKYFISIHPVYMDSPLNAAKALLFGCVKVTLGARWGPRRVGLSKDSDGAISAEPETQAKLDAILADIGEPPSGFGVPFLVRNVQRARLRKYVPEHATCGSHGIEEPRHAIIRAASDTLNVQCRDCGTEYKLA